MKKRTVSLMLLLMCLLFFGAAQAAGGDADDPLLSLSYLKNTFQRSIETRLEEKLDISDEKLLNDAQAEWNRVLAAAQANTGSQYAGVYCEGLCKQDDVLSGSTGLQILVLSGSVRVQFSSGAVIDATDGVELQNGSIVPLSHRLLVAEDTTATFTVLSKAAVLDYCGRYYFLPSSRPDYNAMADALRSLNLFRGTGIGIGKGYELTRIPTRTEALVMLIRLLGEEGDALSCTAQSPFTDVDPWAVPYVAYAYEKGYSNGIGGGLFGSAIATNPQMYIEFILRALGYSSTAHTDISDALDRAYSLGILTAGERAGLLSSDFLRADITYLSFYALSAPVSGSGIKLSDKLISSGVFTSSDYRKAIQLVTTSRLS